LRISSRRLLPPRPTTTSETRSGLAPAPRSVGSIVVRFLLICRASM
jgi:hypothetical protein